MGNAFIDNEVKKIIESDEFEYPLNAAMAATWIIGNFKGFNLKVIDVEGRSSLADYFLLASCDNVIQAQAICDEISMQLKKYGVKTLSIEGKNDAEWILLDLGDIIIHIFQDNAREIINLDSLWIDYKTVPIPESYYNTIEPTTEDQNNNKSYF